jgi:5'-nucleotidase
MQRATLVDRRPNRAGVRSIGLALVVVAALLMALLPPGAADAQPGNAKGAANASANAGKPSTPAPQEGATVEIKLLATNDFHGRLEPPSGDLGGAAYLSTHMQAIKDANPYVLQVDAGDLVGATPVLSNLFYDEPTVEAMNIMGLDVQTVGNHEFDRGQNEILRRRDGGCYQGDCDYRGGMPFEGQDFETLSSNVIIASTGQALTLERTIKRFDWGPTSKDQCRGNGWRDFAEMQFRNQGQCVSFVASNGRAGGQGSNQTPLGGVNVGFVGVTTVNTPNVVSPVGIQGLVFQTEAEAVNREVANLEADGADVIVVLMHEGGRQDVANPDPNACVNFTGAAANIIPQFTDGIDVVVTGHTHQSYICDFADGPLVTQAFEYGKRFSEITLEVDVRTGDVVSRDGFNHDVTRDVTPDPEIQALIAHYQALAGPALREVVGTSLVPIPRTGRAAESIQGNLAADALIDQYGTDFAFQNSGGLRADLTRPPTAVDPPQLDENGLYNIARENVLAVWPFGNIVALAEVDGPTLKAILDNGVYEVGGGRFMQVAGLRVDYYVDGTTPAGFPRGVIANVQYWNHPDFPNGTPVDLSPSASYTIALNDFMAAGGDNYPVLGDRVYSLQDPLEVAVERYLEANSPVNPQIEGRIVQIPAP